MSPQIEDVKSIPFGTPPKFGNVRFEICGLALNYLNRTSPTAIWESAILEGTGAPQHLPFQAWVKYIDSYNFTYQSFALNLPAHNSSKDRFLNFFATGNSTPGGYYSANAGQYDIKHVGNFSDFEVPRGAGVPLDRSDEVSITKININGGVGYASEISIGMNGQPIPYRFGRGRWRMLAKGLGIAMKCSPGSVLNVVMNNSGRSTAPIPLSIPPLGHTLHIRLDNDCNHQGPDVDFPFYYNIPRDNPARNGIVAPRNRTVLTPHMQSLKGRMNGRVACNAMIASELDGHSSLWAAL